MDFLEYIVDKALILIPALMFFGKALKEIPKFPDWCIPWALLVLGVIGACLIMGWSGNSVIQGVLVAGATVYGNQLWKQTRDKDTENKE